MPAKKKIVPSSEKAKGANQQKGKKVCTCCTKEKNLTEFYLSYSPMNQLDNRVPVCKTCCKTSVLKSDGTIDYPAFNRLLQQLDKPLYYELIQSSHDSVKKENSFISEEEVEFRGEDILSKYFTLVSMRQTRAKSYADGEKEGHFFNNNNRTVEERKAIIEKYAPLFNGEIANFVTVSKNVIAEKYKQKDKIIESTFKNFKVTQEMIDMFGDGYPISVYKKMYEKYEKLKVSYALQTTLHQEALATYVRFKVQEELATAKGDVAEAKKWFDAANTAAESGKLQARQISKADLDGQGVNSISEIVKAVEQAVDVVKILPRFKYRPNDAPDFNIWCYINYERRLNDQPLASYEDVYEFYDKRKEDYIAQNGDPYGIFTNDTAEKNRDTVKTFIKLPDDYNDVAGDSDDSE